VSSVDAGAVHAAGNQTCDQFVVVRGCRGHRDHDPGGTAFRQRDQQVDRVLMQQREAIRAGVCQRGNGLAVALEPVSDPADLINRAEDVGFAPAK